MSDSVRKFIGIALLLFAAAVLLAPSLPFGGDGIGPQSGDRHALIVEESADRRTLPTSQLMILEATAPGSFDEYAKKTFGPGGFFVLDKDDDVSRMPAWVQAAMSHPTTIPTPRICVARGEKISVYALPKDTAAAIAITK